MIALKTLKKQIKLGVLIFVLFINSTAYAEGTPRFSFHFVDIASTSYENVQTGDSFEGELYLINRDHTRTINISLLSTGFGNNDFVTFSEDSFELSPGEEANFTFNFAVPEATCENQYDVFMYSRLTSYTDHEESDGASVQVFSQIALKLNLSVESGITCASERVVFYDKDGDQVYEPANGEKPLNMGTVKIYDAADDSLLLSTNLAESNGQYEQPTGSFSGVKDVYFVVETDSVTDGVADLVEGNLYVDRRGSSSAFQNVHRVNGISSYADLSGNVDVRSRNTDQVGTWTGGDVSIGPDDKDQIISPLHWDNLVSGSDYPYADLDHDGRIDPDDKDHVISPLYWDFPN